MAPLSDRPFALFGHSLGGHVALEVARLFRRRNLPAPVRLFASACRAPHLPYPFSQLHDLDENDLLQQVNERYDRSVPSEVLESSELRELFVPTLRADLTALETYRHQEQPPLGCPISVFGGSRDRTLSREALEAWSVHTSQGFRLRLVNGGHFYLQSARQELIDSIREDLAAVLASPPVPAGA
jgi:surfactin synthase thioesterase subunit